MATKPTPALPTAITDDTFEFAMRGILYSVVTANHLVDPDVWPNMTAAAIAKRLQQLQDGAKHDADNIRQIESYLLQVAPEEPVYRLGITRATWHEWSVCFAEGIPGAVGSYLRSNGQQVDRRRKASSSAKAGQFVVRDVTGDGFAVYSIEKNFAVVRKALGRCELVDESDLLERLRRESENARGLWRREQPLKTEGDAGSHYRHSADYRSVYWDGEEYEFTRLQAACVEVLWGTKLNKTPTLYEQTILELAESSQDRLQKVFDRGGHPAWNRMIVSGRTKGTFRLAPEKK